MALGLAGCAAPRTGTWSPTVTPKGHVVAAAHTPINFPSSTADALYGGLDESIKALSLDDTSAIAPSDLNGLIRALYAYSLDPLGSGFEMQARYGLGWGLDLGYAYATGAHAFSASWQFMGMAPQDTVALRKVPVPWQGSVSVQYAWQTFELPSFLYLDKLQKVLRYEFKRRDVLIPMALGKPLGDAGRYGSFAFGPSLNLSWVEYGSDLSRLVESLDDGSRRAYENLSGSLFYASYGAFANARLGYKPIYVVFSLSAFYQDYGRIRLLNGEKAEFSGMTYIPSVGLELRF